MIRASFIQIAKQHGVAALVGSTLPHQGGFDQCVAGALSVKSVDPHGVAECVMKVGDEHCNSYGTLHGGAVSTVVDIMGTLALLGMDNSRAGVSVELNVSYLRAVKNGSEVTCLGRVEKSGKLLGFTRVELWSEGKLVATGRHTKAM